ncbi:MAG: hypothetical protein AAGJ70_04060 [Pseudomonadota bacterium]
MKLTRRSILQLTGATGAIGLATGGTGVHAAANAAQTALNVGDGPYVLTHDGRILARVGNYHDAVRQAAELRQTMQAPIAHQRCSQELWRTLGEKAGQHAETLWHEVDGLAVTPDEMEERAFEFLRRAKVPEAARKKLWRHHAEALREDCMLRQQARDDLKAYACLNGQIIAVGHDVEDLAQTHDEPDITFFSCTPELATALERHLAEPDTPQPDIETSFLVHMTPRELTELTASDPWYAAAAQMRAEKKPRHVPESRPARRETRVGDAICAYQ